MSSRLDRRRFLQVMVGTSALAVAAACAPSTPAPTAAPKAAPTTAPAKPTAAAATKPAEKAAASPAAKAATQAPAKPVTMSKFTLALNAKNFTSSPLYAAQKAGIFKDRGIQLETPEFANGNLIIRAVVSKAADTGIVSTQPIYSAHEGGADLVMVAAEALPTSFAIVANKPEIKKLEDLYGRTVGANGPGAGLENFVIALLQAKNLDPSKLNFVNIGATIEQWKALASDKVDAAVVISSEFPLLKQFPQLHVVSKGWEELPFFNRFGSPMFREDITKREDLYNRFFVALSQAYRWGLDHKTETVAAAMEALNFSKEDSEAAFDDLIENKLLNPSLAFTEKHVEYMQQLSVDAGQQKAIIPFEKAADLRFVKHVEQVLGPYKPKA